MISVISAQLVRPSQSPLLVDFEAIVTSKWIAIFLFLPLPRWLCFQFVCLSVCQQDYTRTTEQIFFLKLYGGVGQRQRKSPLYFGSGPDKGADEVMLFC